MLHCLKEKIHLEGAITSQQLQIKSFIIKITVLLTHTKLFKYLREH